DAVFEYLPAAKTARMLVMLAEKSERGQKITAGDVLEIVVSFVDDVQTLMPGLQAGKAFYVARQAAKEAAKKAAGQAIGKLGKDASAKEVAAALRKAAEDAGKSTLEAKALRATANAIEKKGMAAFQKSGGCFAAGMPLLTPDGARAVEDFRPGDLILSRSE